jgi:hypothetical protein
MAKDAKRPVITLEHLELKTSEARPTLNSIIIPHTLFPKSESEISAEGFQNAVKWMERTYIECSLELMKNDNQAVYTKINISKAQYFKLKKVIEPLSDPEL